MKSFYFLLPLFFIFLFGHGIVLSQVRDTVNNGQLQGVAKDAFNKRTLPFATVSVYNVIDSSLLGYQLTNNFGRFFFKNLPKRIPIRIVVSHTGYSLFQKESIIPSLLEVVDVDTLFLTRWQNELSEVVVKAFRPPIHMNKDTLEFNAEAFKLDKNAVVEDLLRKLPGITIWGDGKITVNGRTVKNVLVDGKPFFGESGSIATHNLPKEAVDKIQVYTKVDNTRSSLDSLVNINIKLKKGNKKGYFGKLGAGYGSEERYNNDGMISFYSPRTQFSVAGMGNNVNTIPKNTTDLIENSAFGGISANVEYQPNFEMEGLSKLWAGGVDFTHYFIPDMNDNKNNRVRASYFNISNKYEAIRKTKTNIKLENDVDLVLNNENLTNSNINRHLFSSDYILINKKVSLFVKQSLQLNVLDNFSGSINSSIIGLQGIQSVDTSSNSLHSNEKKLMLNAELENTARSMHFDYSFSLENTEQTRFRFINFQTVTMKTFYNRNYRPEGQKVSNNLNLNYKKLKKLLFGKWAFFNIEMGFLNSMHITHENNIDIVNDFSNTNQRYLPNLYLTNNSRYTAISESPAIYFERAFFKTLTNRYKKNIRFYAEVKTQMMSQKNESEKEFQRLNNFYNNIIPQFSITYLNDQFADHQLTFAIKYNTQVNYATLEQLVALIDSSDIFYQHKGNAVLAPSYKKELGFFVHYSSSLPKSLFNQFNIDARAGRINNVFSDSTVYDNFGRAVNYTVNAGTGNYFSINCDFNKAIKKNQHQWQISGSSTTFLNSQTNFINNAGVGNNTLQSNNNVRLLYNYKDFLAVELGETMSFYRSKQEGAVINEFNNSTLKTTCSATIRLIKKISIASNISYNKNKTSFSPNTHFTIWNADMRCRLFKGNQCEIKARMLDILHQNKNIINYGNSQGITTGTVNVLQQYFMVTLSYFPRQFGKKSRR